MAGENFTAAELAVLRGTLEPSSNTARDLAITAQTRCTRRRALAVIGIKSEAAARLLGPIPPSEQSPFAFEIGRRFEGALRRDGAERLKEALGEELGLDFSALPIIDIDAEHPWRGRDRRANATAAEARLVRTDELLAAHAQTEEPFLVLHPRMTLTLTDTSRHTEADAILFAPGQAPMPVEIKAYVDHGHRTDTHDLASTRLQLAVYHLALEQAQRRLGLTDGAQGATPRINGLVVLRKPNSMFGSASLEDITRDVFRIKRGLGRAPVTLADVLSVLPSGSSLDDPEVLRCLPTRYAPGYCLASCAMSLQCRAEAAAQALPEYLGSPVTELLAAVGDLRRAHALATGNDEPEGDEERAFAERARPVRARIDTARSRCS